MPIRKTSQRITLVLLLAALPVAAPVTASAMTCPAKLGPAEQIACLQTQNAILKELIASKDLVKKLDGDTAKPRQLDLPVVLSIFGVDGHVQHLLLLSGGPSTTDQERPTTGLTPVSAPFTGSTTDVPRFPAQQMPGQMPFGAR